MKLSYVSRTLGELSDTWLVGLLMYSSVIMLLSYLNTLILLSTSNMVYSHTNYTQFSLSLG